MTRALPFPRYTLIDLASWLWSFVFINWVDNAHSLCRRVILWNAGFGLSLRWLVYIVNSLGNHKIVSRTDSVQELIVKENYWIMERMLQFAYWKTTGKLQIFFSENVRKCVNNALFSNIHKLFSERVNTIFFAVKVALEIYLLYSWLRWCIDDGLELQDDVRWKKHAFPTWNVGRSQLAI